MNKFVCLLVCLLICTPAFAQKTVNGQVQEAEISFTAQEAQVAVQLFDLATKSGGLQVAEPAIVLTKKFQDAFKTQETNNQKAPRGQVSPVPTTNVP